MVNLKNKNPEEFRQYIKEKKVVVFGAGRALNSVIISYFEDKDIDFVVDNNKAIWGTVHRFSGRTYHIKSPKELIKIYSTNRDVVCLIDSPFYAIEILRQLDSISELDGMECYVHLIMRNTISASEPFEFTEGEQLIPKKIHYIWVGGSELSPELRKNIESWKKYNPDYEIIRWDENNYDFTKYHYTRQAYECRAWAFASNMARFDIVYNEGGIYLDTDVEAIAGFDKVLNDNTFFNMGNSESINSGCGFGSIAKSELLKEIVESYAEDSFLDDRSKPKRIQDHMYVHPIMKRKGFVLNNQYQNIDGIVLYPSEVMSPKTIDGMEDNYTCNTISVHKMSGSWKKSMDKNNESSFISEVLERVK